ncbi:MAG: hypothetical protein ACKPKO_48165, partial [Candidatus Fonsibacter sp.]
AIVLGKLHTNTMYSHVTYENKTKTHMRWSALASECLRPSWPRSNAARATLMLEGNFCREQTDSYK